MSTPSFTSKQVNQFEENIVYMKRLIGVYVWPSCNKIRAYLTIYGKMKASQLSELLGLQGAKSVYKPLNRLMQAGMIEKEFDAQSQRNASYFISTHSTNDPDFTPDFIAYLMQQNQYNIVSEYLTAANHGSVSFIEVMSSIMEQRIISSQNPTLGSAYIESTLFIETLLSLPDPGPLLHKFEQLIEQEFPQYINRDMDPKVGMSHPAAFFLAIVPLTDN